MGPKNGCSENRTGVACLPREWDSRTLVQLGEEGRHASSRTTPGLLLLRTDLRGAALGTGMVTCGATNGEHSYSERVLYWGVALEWVGSSGNPVMSEKGAVAKHV